MPAIAKVTENAKQTQARAIEMSLVYAIKSYWTEYNQLPVPKDQETSESIPITSSGSLLDALLAEDSNINPRMIKFLDTPLVRNSTGGLLEKDAKRLLVDPWGNAYFILLDLNNDNRIPDPEHPGTTLNASVLVFSAGVDGDPGTWKDNVASWR